MGLANEDDLGGETIQQAKVFKFKILVFTLVELLPQVILQILFLWLQPKIQFVCDSI
jgi:hypothetical protein